MRSTRRLLVIPLLQERIHGLVFMRLLTLSVLFGGFIVASSSAVSVARPRADSSLLERTGNDNDGLVVLPLLSHADMEKRYRRERRQRRSIVEERHTKDEMYVEKKNNGWIPSQSDVDPLYQGSGTHYVDLWVGCGDSPQRQTLVVDTGSSITAFPCANECIKISRNDGEQQQQQGTNQCDPYQRHAGTPYQEDQSPCFRYVACQAHHECTTLPSPTATNVCSNDTATTNVGGQCRLGSAYLDGSTWSAVEAMDKVYTGGSHEAPVATSSRENTFDLRFACQTSVTGLFQILFEDGIMGMDRTKSSYWNQYFDNINNNNNNKQKNQRQRQFALCLAKNSNRDRNGSGAGAMILGGTDPRLHATPMAYAQLVNHDQYFVVWLEKIHLRLNGGPSLLVPNGDINNDNAVRYQTVEALPIELNRGSVIIDSGTTATFFSENLAKSFQQAYRALTGTEFDTSERAMTIEELNSMPTILFQLSPAKIHQQQQHNNHKTASHYKHEEPGVVAGRLDPDHADAILVALPPHRYMRYIEKRQTYAPEIQFTEHAGRNQILGAYFMDGKMIHFDVDNRRVGFAESTCNYAAPNPKFGDMTYPAFENHPPPLHEKEEVESMDAWFDSLDDPNSESSMKKGNKNHANNKKKSHHKIRLVATLIVLILVVVSLLAACTLRLIRRGRELRQFQKRQRQGGGGGGGETNNLPQEGRQRQGRNKSNNKQDKRQKPSKKKQRQRHLRHEEEAMNRFDADGLERMAMLDFPTFGGESNDDDDYNDNSGLMFDRFRDEPSVGDNDDDDIELSAAR